MNEEDKTGGHAFPTDVEYVNSVEKYIDPQPGMTLRDYFAAKALQALIGTFPEDDPCNHISQCCKESYSFADAMIKQRNES